MRRFPARKLVGVAGTVFAYGMAVGFGFFFLLKSLKTWTPIPDGIISLVSLFFGSGGATFGVYAASSTYEATHRVTGAPEVDAKEGGGGDEAE